MIDIHLATRAPGLCAPANPWLFPRRNGSGPINTAHFSTRIKSFILRETGLVVHAHLFRHLAARNWLDAFPGQYEVVKRLLGHSSVSQTLNLYAGFEAGTATRLFAEVIDAKRRT
jgi:integrase